MKIWQILQTHLSGRVSPPDDGLTWQLTCPCPVEQSTSPACAGRSWACLCLLGAPDSVGAHSPQSPSACSCLTFTQSSAVSQSCCPRGHLCPCVSLLVSAPSLSTRFIIPLTENKQAPLLPSSWIIAVCMLPRHCQVLADK